ncbi:hypothetical protein [Kribbella sp. NPDC051718]|uniref:hypothetical protein n=1 Tax=Kribbella sp. NPDC051718 TaxID=3155168 RepID=UPI003436136E
MITAGRVYSPAVLAALALLAIPLLGAARSLSTELDDWPHYAPFCRENKAMAASGHKPGWCI